MAEPRSDTDFMAALQLEHDEAVSVAVRYLFALSLSSYCIYSAAGLSSPHFVQEIWTALRTNSTGPGNNTWTWLRE